MRDVTARRRAPALQTISNSSGGHFICLLLERSRTSLLSVMAVGAALVSAVRALHAAEGSHYEAELRNGVRLPIGRTRYKELRAKLR